MDRTQNLKPWPKGTSGNPGGRPKRKPFHDAIEAAFTSEDAEAIVLVLIASAKRKRRPDIKAAEFLRDSYEGKPSKALDVSGDITVGLAEGLARARERRLLKAASGLPMPTSHCRRADEY
jgi:hypothetical protein